MQTSCKTGWQNLWIGNCCWSPECNIVSWNLSSWSMKGIKGRDSKPRKKKKKPECINCRGNIRYLGCTTYFKLHIRRWRRLCARLTRVILFRVCLFIFWQASDWLPRMFTPGLQKPQSSQDRKQKTWVRFIKHYTDKDTINSQQQKQVLINVGKQLALNPKPKNPN